MSRVSVNKLQDTFKNISLKTKEKISDLVGSVKGDDIQTDIVLREGKAGQKIVELSNDLKPDLIGGYFFQRVKQCVTPLLINYYQEEIYLI